MTVLAEAVPMMAPLDGLLKVTVSLSLLSPTESSVTARVMVRWPMLVKVSVPLSESTSPAVMPAPPTVQFTVRKPLLSATPNIVTVKVMLPTSSAAVAALAAMEKTLPSLARMVMVKLVCERVTVSVVVEPESIAQVQVMVSAPSAALSSVMTNNDVAERVTVVPLNVYEGV